MPIEAHWAVLNQVVYIQQWGIIQLEDMLATDHLIGKMATSADNPMVHGIIDKLAVEDFQCDPKAIQAAFMDRPKPTQGWVVAVHHTRFSAFLSQLMAQSQHMKTWTFHDLSEAKAFLQKQDEALLQAEWLIGQREYA